ncbi:MAG: sulfite exporter TauE/SafE family protein [Jiangellaceae bacterium]|nr:sulfite exporter TauE/SafE family protein [Jiangellaceae bacterium]
MIDGWLAVAAVGVGVVVGLTGMGGGALMTPLLVFFFGVPPLAAVSSDLVASAVMKPVGGLVHLRHGTVNLALVRWLCVGSVPAAFSGVLIAKALGDSAQVDQFIQKALGAALLVAAAGLVARAYMRLTERARRRDLGLSGEPASLPPPAIAIRPVPTVMVGVLGGVVVGLTSVGSGSLIIISLLALYPTLRAAQLVGTDLVQAVPLVMAAAIGHLLFGDFQFHVAAALVLGSVPGVWAGAMLSSRAPGGLIRRALAIVLAVSGLKLLGAPNTLSALAVVALVLVGPLLWMAVRRRHGFPAVSHRSTALLSTWMRRRPTPDRPSGRR